MDKVEILDNLEGLSEEETVSIYDRATLAEWWAVLYGKVPSKSRTALQMAHDMHQMLRTCSRARVLSRGIFPR